MTGRSLHDALLRALCEAPLRRALSEDPVKAAAALGSEEASALTRADRTRLTRLARFMARHFYRERLVRLFRHTRAVLRRAGKDPLDVLDDPAFREILDAATLGDEDSAERVAVKIEERCRADAGAAGGAIPPYFEDLIRYEGTLFRVEAGPRRWRDRPSGEPAEAGAVAPRLSPWARVFEMEHDLPPVLDAIEDASRPLPDAARKRVRLIASLDPQGTVHVVRCPEGVARLLGHLDGRRALAEAAAASGLQIEQAEGVAKQLRDIGALIG